MGIMTCVKNTLVDRVETKEIIKGRAIRSILKDKGRELNLINIYGPPDQRYRQTFFSALLKKTRTMGGKFIIGDWNLILDADQTTGQYTDSPYKRDIKQDLKRQNLVDVHTNMNQGINYTFRSTKGTRARIDKVFVSGSIRNRIIEYKIKTNTISDHDSINISIGLDEEQERWGKGDWKLNNEILKEEDLQGRVLELFNTYLMNKGRDFGKTWDKFKEVVKKECIHYSIQRKEEQIHFEREAMKIVDHLQGKIDNGLGDQTDQDLLDEIKEEVREFEEEKIRGLRTRAKLDDIQHNERPTSYFYKKIREKEEGKHIRALFNDDDELAEEKDEILTTIHNFYQELYKSEGIDLQQMTENLDTINLTLSEDDARALNRPITKEEVHKAIKNMRKGKSPGNDGLTAEFYQQFGEFLEDEITELMNNIMLSGELPKSQKEATLKLLFKKGDHRHLKNWRPVSLLNVDYKILSKIMTFRLSEYMEKITPIEQKCGVKGRQMRDIIRNIDVICEEMNEKGGYLMLLDQQKAFDRVNHTYMLAVLQKMGINGRFLGLIKAMYNDISSRVEVNGAKTDKIEVQRSVRQGCPFSMMIFVLTSVPLINMINNSNKLTGYKTRRGRTIKIQSYADDNTVMLSTPDEMDEVLKIYDKHSAACEAKINADKTEILKLGQRHDREKSDFKKFRKKKVKILGTWFTENRDDISTENIEYIRNKILNQIDALKGVRLTLLGKILIINSSFWSLFWHCAWVINTSDKLLDEVISDVSKFIQAEKATEVYDQVAKPKRKGGLNLLNLKERIVAIKVKQLENLNQIEPEHDDLLFYIGTRQKKVFGKLIDGPKKEINNNKYEKTISLATQHIKKIGNIEKTKTKDIQQILFNKIDEYTSPAIFWGNKIKHHAMNYKIAKNILNNRPSEYCQFCGRNPETVKHLFVECSKLYQIRNQIREWISLLRNSPTPITPDMILRGIYVKTTLEQFLLSEYKIQVWIVRSNRKWRGGDTTLDNIIGNIERSFRFQMLHFGFGEG